MIECLAVGMGGFIGASLRYIMGFIVIKDSTFPLMTMLINIIGAFLIGIIAAIASKYNLDSRWVLFLKTGICGGFTTFSTFSLESMNLISDGKLVIAMMYIFLSIILCLLFVWLGNLAVKVLL